MKFFIILFILSTSAICSAEINVKIYYEKTENGYSVYADNDEYCPVSIKLDFDLQNLKVTNASETHVIEAKTNRQLLTDLVIAGKGKTYKFSYKSKYTRGNVMGDSNYEKDYLYSLPFKSGNSFILYQGYDGSFSHQDKFALDFTMPVGTEIVAIRDGIVVAVVEENDKGCGTEDCKKYNNYISIYHTDGTFSEYVHIQKNGSVVNVGDSVLEGQLIAQSGNVGWSTGPHLHLEIYLPKFGERKTIKTQFKIDNGETSEYLKEKNEYSKNY